MDSGYLFADTLTIKEAWSVVANKRVHSESPEESDPLELMLVQLIVPLTAKASLFCFFFFLNFQKKKKKKRFEKECFGNWVPEMKRMSTCEEKERKEGVNETEHKSNEAKSQQQQQQQQQQQPQPLEREEPNMELVQQIDNNETTNAGSMSSLAIASATHESGTWSHDHVFPSLQNVLTHSAQLEQELQDKQQELVKAKRMLKEYQNLMNSLILKLEFRHFTLLLLCLLFQSLFYMYTYIFVVYAYVTFFLCMYSFCYIPHFNHTTFFFFFFLKKSDTIKLSSQKKTKETEEKTDERVTLVQSKITNELQRALPTMITYIEAMFRLLFILFVVLLYIVCIYVYDSPFWWNQLLGCETRIQVLAKRLANVCDLVLGFCDVCNAFSDNCDRIYRAVKQSWEDAENEYAMDILSLNAQMNEFAQQFLDMSSASRQLGATVNIHQYIHACTYICTYMYIYMYIYFANLFCDIESEWKMLELIVCVCVCVCVMDKDKHRIDSAHSGIYEKARECSACLIEGTGRIERA
ncbi:hypothetical protein RFI_30050, partial [Reticulomyxa filosa]